MTWFIVPMKNGSNAKSRLESVLNGDERVSLVREMLSHVLGVLQTSDRCTGILVVTRDDILATLARTFGAEVFSTPQDTGLNAALGAACEQLDERGVRDAAILHADLPRVSLQDIAVLTNRAQGTVTLACCKNGMGTNAIGFDLPMVGDFTFGAGSFSRHRVQFEQSGRSVVVLDRPGLARDVDVPPDLAYLEPDSRATQGIPQELAYALVDERPEDLSKLAARVARRGFGRVVTYSPKVFLPLTQLCRDVCHYCTFAQSPKKLDQLYMSPDQVLDVARRGAELGCKEALFTLGERPELRYPAARKALEALGFSSTLDYLGHIAGMVLQETGLLPHLNPGAMTRNEMERLRPVAASMGMMLESGSERLCEKGMPHFGSPDKQPNTRWVTLRAAGELRIPFTTGLLVGIGETRSERVTDLLAIRTLQEEFGHIQEVIIQNFCAKPGTRMANNPDASLPELLWTISAARLILGPEMSIQAPPNLSPSDTGALIRAGINDWGGVSPLTQDYVNPEAPWPHLEQLRKITEKEDRDLEQRLTIYPGYVREVEAWAAAPMHHPIRALADGDGFAMPDAWRPGSQAQFPAIGRSTARVARGFQRLVGRAADRKELGLDEIKRLFQARGAEFDLVCRTADQLRREQVGETVTHVINRNINYTNICYFKCSFCAFSKGKTHEDLRGKPYRLGLDEIVARAANARSRGATEVCLQGGIHPDYTGETYIEICSAIHGAVPDLHIHAFSPLEVWQGAKTMGLSLQSFLRRLQSAGLRSLPGTAAEILSDDVRATLCPDKISTAEWLQVMRSAHEVGLKSTATIMFGHVDRYEHWARHLIHIRDMQAQTKGFTEIVPLPFVAVQSPVYLKQGSRSGPSVRESVVMHAVARLVLGELLPNVQTSWVKLGADGATQCLNAGANDLGGTLMDETITRSAGGKNGSEMSVDRLREISNRAGRPLAQRYTDYTLRDAPSLVVGN
ncbi:5-amino-6-(D-ribitylamino)uracil--L-tyrosine 4-hydroxyphenyl transferase CofH [Ruegeria sp.]|uniref:5-amino-6-(D-ribitylamino)uracil--L-tyrosine 4-hydroxyphenyl transferase CofH n=1 Tax=Ruegeria sp. TaxID=1879320 RepID=UPI003C7D74DB